jgi:hypothetical protein
MGMADETSGAAWASMLPGVELARLLASVDVAAVRSDADVLELIAAWERVISWAQVQQLDAIAEFVRRPVVVGTDPHAGWAARGVPGRPTREFADDELAVRLGTSRVAAASRVGTALSLAVTHEATAAALREGAIDFSKARLIVESTSGLAVDVAREIEAKVLPRAGEQNCGRLKQVLRRAVIVADPAGAEQRRKRARSERRVVITPMPDDMAELYAVLPALQAAAIDTALTASARAMKAELCDADRRTMDQLRADALAAPFEVALSTGVLDGLLPTRLEKVRGSRAQLQVPVPASVLLGISDAPGHLAGYGPITAATAREIAEDATWRRILTDPVRGAVLDVGTTTYRPPAPLDRHVKTRDGTCRQGSCNWPAHLCELDHTIPFPLGPTAHGNLGPLCKRHHIAKGRPGRRVVQAAPGVFTWTMPTGHTYTVRPEPIALPLAEELGTRIAGPDRPPAPCRQQPKPRGVARQRQPSVRQLSVGQPSVCRQPRSLPPGHRGAATRAPTAKPP